MKTKLVSFEQIECDALAKLITHLSSSPNVAKGWSLSHDDADRCTVLGAPTHSTDYNVEANRGYLRSIFHLTACTGCDEHKEAGLDDNESDAVFGLYEHMDYIELTEAV